MPRMDHVPGRRLSVLRKFRRIMKWMALFSIVIAAVAVLLVMRGEKGVQIHMMIATALGAGLSVLLAGALMSLVFISADTGHDDHANRSEEDKDS